MQKRKLISIFIALAVSVGLWLYVVTVENPEGSEQIYNVPVNFSGEEVLREDYELLITDASAPSGVTLTFEGRRADLKKLIEHKSELAVNIDVTQIRSAREYDFTYTVSDITMPAAISSSGLSLTDTNPNTLTITVEKLEKRPVQVKVSPNVKVKPEYLSDLPTTDYDEITIEGPAEVVNRVKYAMVTLERENLDQTVVTKLPYTLMDENGEIVESDEITSNVSEIEVTLRVSKYKDVPLEVGVLEGGGATKDDTTIEITPSTVRISGDAAVLDTVSSIKLSNIDLASMKSNSENFTRTIPIPEGCKSLSGEVEANVEVQIKNKAIRTMKVSSSNFQFVNKPAGVDVESRTTVILVTVRANEADIEHILEENLRVVVDLAEASIPESGAFISVPYKVYVDGFEGAGVITTDSAIVVDLKAIEP